MFLSLALYLTLFLFFFSREAQERQILSSFKHILEIMREACVEAIHRGRGQKNRGQSSSKGSIFVRLLSRSHMKITSAGDILLSVGSLRAVISNSTPISAEKATG